jgi:hypothetical protein
MQLSSFSNASGADAEAGLLELANAVRAANEPVPEGLHRRIWPIYYRCLDRDPMECPAPAVDRVLPPVDQLRTFRWLYADSLADTDRRAVFGYQLARLEERAGASDSALVHYQAMASELRALNPRIADQVRRAIARLSRR